jgi:hypothetical protein
MVELAGVRAQAEEHLQALVGGPAHLRDDQWRAIEALAVERRGGGGGGPPPYLTARLLRGIKNPARSISRLRQHEVREIFEHPLVLQRSIDDPE